MRAKISYMEREYGNRASAPQFKFTIERVQYADLIQIRFQFASPAPGLGVGDTAGAVTDGFIELSVEAAQQLALAIQLHGATRHAAPTEITVDEQSRSPSAFRAA